MTRELMVGAAQLGPISRDESRESVIDRLIALLAQGAEHGCELVVFPELALTTFFPRWYLDEGGPGGLSAIDGDTSELDAYYEIEMPSAVTRRLFDEAKRLAVGFCLGYAELTPPDEHGVQHRYNTYMLVDGAGDIVGKYRKVHIPGHEDHEPWRTFQHLERRYFEESPDGFDVWEAFGGTVGMAICNDRRWPESYRPTHHRIRSRRSTTTLSCKPARIRTARGWSGLRRAASKRVFSRLRRPRSLPRRVRLWRSRSRSTTSWWSHDATSTCVTATRRPCSTSTGIAARTCTGLSPTPGTGR